MYGSYNDLLLLSEEAENRRARRSALEGAQIPHAYEALQAFCRREMAERLGDEEAGLVAKWAPREGASKDARRRQARILALSLFPELKPAGAFRAYRKLVASGNEKLGTVETRMCSGRWRDIDPAKVPAACLRRNRAAFLRGGNEDREACQTRFLEHVLAGKAVHGAAQ